MLKIFALITSIMMILPVLPSNGEDQGSVFTSPHRLLSQEGRGSEVSSEQRKNIFVPLSEVNPDRAEAGQYAAKGNMALEKGEREQAEALFRQALLLDQRNVSANVALGKMLFQSKQYLKAREHLLRVLEEDPNHIQALLHMGRINFSIFKRTEAFEFFQEVAELNPGNMEAAKYINYILGKSVAENGLPDEYYTIPYAPILTRGELAALVFFRTDKLKRVKTPPRPLIITDINGSWAENYIREVTKYGVINVYPNHTFQPETPVNHGEFARVAMNLLQSMGLYSIYESNAPRKNLIYEDIDPFNNYYKAVKLVTDLEIIIPGDDRRFNLGQNLSGALAVEYFDNFDNAVKLLSANR